MPAMNLLTRLCSHQCLITVSTYSGFHKYWHPSPIAGARYWFNGSIGSDVHVHCDKVIILCFLLLLFFESDEFVE